MCQFQKSRLIGHTQDIMAIFGHIMATCGKICSGRTKDTMAFFGHIDIMATCKARVKLEFWAKMI